MRNTIDDPLKLPAWVGWLRLLPASLPGKARLARLLLRNLIQRQGNIHVEAQGMSFVGPSLREPIMFNLAVHGLYEPDTCELLRRTLPRDGVLLDVGANIGVFSLMAARLWCPEGQIISVEASPRVHACLARNVAANGLTNVTALHVAATAAPGTIQFFEAPESNFGMGSLAPRFDAKATVVTGETLDSIVTRQAASKIDLIKMDVEGFEVDALSGATGIFAQNPSIVIVFEFNDWAETREGCSPGAAQRFLIQQGFQLWKLNDYLHGKPALKEPLIKGSTDLVARRAS